MNMDRQNDRPIFKALFFWGPTKSRATTRTTNKAITRYKDSWYSPSFWTKTASIAETIKNRDVASVAVNLEPMKFQRVFLFHFHKKRFDSSTMSAPLPIEEISINRVCLSKKENIHLVLRRGVGFETVTRKDYKEKNKQEKSRKPLTHEIRCLLFLRNAPRQPLDRRCRLFGRC